MKFLMPARAGASSASRSSTASAAFSAAAGVSVGRAGQNLSNFWSWAGRASSAAEPKPTTSVSSTTCGTSGRGGGLLQSSHICLGNTHMCTKTQLQQVYCSLPIRRRWRTALKKGTMKWDEKIGQLLMPPLIVEGHEKGKPPYKGKFRNCRAQRVMFQH